MRLRVPSLTPRRCLALSALVYLAYAIAITWPFALHPQSTIFGVVGSDLTGSIARYREFAQELQAPFLSGRLHDFDAPFGLRTQPTLEYGALPSTTYMWLLCVGFGGVAGYGVFILTSFVFTALGMCLLVRRQTGSSGAAFVAGLAFGFWPYVFSTSAQPLGHGWVLVLLLWRALVVAERPTLRNSLLLGLAAAFAVAWTQYWILIAAVVFGTLACVAVASGPRARRDVVRRLGLQALAGGVVLVWLASVLFVASTDDFGQVPVRSASDTIRYSARPLMYVLPGPHNPLVGHATRKVVTERYFSAGSTADYSPIYVGLSVLLLAAVGLSTLIRGRRTAWPRPAGPALAASLALGVVGFLFSGPPQAQVLGLTVPLPSQLVLHVTTAFRTTGRFALVVMVGLVLLMGYGVARVLAGRSARDKAVIVVILAAIVGVDLWNREPPGPTRLDPPQIYQRLAAEPPGIVATFPITPAVATGTANEFWQQTHGHPIFNGFRRDTESESLKLEFTALTSRNVERIARLGVRYVAVFPDPTVAGPPAGTNVRGLRPIFRESGATPSVLYRVDAAPARAAAHALAGFSPPEGTPPRWIRWMTEATGVVGIEDDCSPCRRELRFRSASFGIPRRLRVRDPEGRLLADQVVGTGITAVVVPVRLTRSSTRLRFSITPGPRAPHDLDPANPDTRTLGVFVSGPLVPLAPRRRP